MEKRLKVLHLINSLSAGGAETLLAHSLAPGGLNEHADNTIVYFRGESYLNKIIDDNVKIIRLSYNRKIDIFNALINLRRIIIDSNFDIIHTHLTPMGLIARLVCPAQIPIVHTLHTTYSMDTQTNRMLLFVQKRFYLKSKKCNIICLSDFAKADFVHSVPFKGNIFVLNNFVADKYFASTVKKYNAKNGSLRLIAVGSLTDVKNYEYLLDVFKHCIHDEIYLDIFGRGDKSKYTKMIYSNKLKIRIMGEYSEISEELKKADLFIMPSKFEGFPLSLFEAMAAGVPVMISNIPPLKSIVKDNGIYFELNDPEATAEIIKSILYNKIDVNKLAEKAKNYAEQIVKRDTYIKKLLVIYKQVIALSQAQNNTLKP